MDQRTLLRSRSTSGSDLPSKAWEQRPQKVALVIVNHNRGDLLGRCLSAVEQQLRKPDRVIIVDNGSTDDSCQIARHSQLEPRLINLPENCGFAGPVNSAVYSAEGFEWIALLNNDAFPEPEWLDALMSEARQNPHCDSFSAKLISDQNPDVVQGTGDAYHISGFAWKRDHGKRVSDVKRSSGAVFSSCAAAALYRREALLNAGGFDPDYFCYFDDVDLGFRMRLLGYRARYVEDAVAQHIGSATAGDRSDFAIYYTHRNLGLTYIKNMPSPLLVRSLPQHLLFSLLSIFWYVSHGQAKPILRAKRDILRMLPSTIRKRRLVQRSAKLTARDLQKVLSLGLMAPYLRNRR